MKLPSIIQGMLLLAIVSLFMRADPLSPPPLFGESSGIAYGINNSGVVVGESGNKAFIWQEGYSAALDLNSFKPSTLNITLYCAEAINGSGVIVGWGLGSGGNWRAFMLSPQ